jgi:hypothetical protein
MNIKIGIENIFSLKNFLNSSSDREKIKQYFRKKTHKSDVGEYKPNSELWLKAKNEDDIIANIPDHNVVLNYEKLEIKYSYHTVEFSIGKITSNETNWCYAMEEYVEKEVTRHFLVENSYWGFGSICSLEELLEEVKIKQMMELMFNQIRKDKWESHLKSVNDGAFILLLDKILNAEESFIPVKILTKIFEHNDVWVEIGEQKYHLKDMIEINKAYKTGDYEFYDENDRKIKYADYLYDSFPDFYLEHMSKN